MTTVGTRAVVSKGKVENVLKKAKWTKKGFPSNPKIFVQIHAVVDSGCSSHMTGNKAYLSDYEDLNGGFVAFGSDPKGVNSGSLQVNSGRLLVNSVDFKLILKPNESVGFTEVVDFLKGTSLRYALTHNPTIYDSLVKQFWQTATVRTLANGTQQLVASIDSKGVFSLNFDQKAFANMKRGYAGDIVPLLPAMLAGAAEDQELKDTKQTLRNVVVKLVKKVKSLETALKRKSKKVLISELEGEESEDQGKKIQDIDDDPQVSLVRESMKEKSTDWLKSIDKGKRYKRRKESKGKDISTSFEDISIGFEDISTGFKEVNTGGIGVSTGSGPVSYARRQKEGKAPMIVEETQAPKRTKEQIQQEEASLTEAIRLQTLEEEETAKQVHLDALLAKRMEEEELTEQQKQRKAQVQFEAQYYTKEDWDTIRAKLEANVKLTKNVIGKELPKEDIAKKMVELVNQRKKFFAEERAKSRRKVKEEFYKLVKQVESFVPINIEATKAQLKRYEEELQTEISKKQRIDVLDTEEKVCKVKEEEPVKRVGKRKKQKARKGISIDKSPQGDSETDKEESVEAMNPTPLDTKSNIVANWKIFQQAMLKDFTREDLIELYRLVMQKYGTNRPEDAYDRVLWSDLRTMFDPPLNEDAIWSLPLQQKMISWRYYDKCAVHCLTLEACNIYMLADRKYPLSKDACQVMLKMKLLDGKMNEVCYKLLKMIEKQAGVKK
ncbi:hypothetical protein Tco_0726533 [Tanacetum coccineum]|uniref:Retrovirus-related Pol polyprotein from transposon TNT 1-94-like beta-barrel domain-containing protein n=1 Tax=Tanacetum coccineum TaxID=301880 RepID=A0ABQ4YGR5_9ASTR